MDDNKQPAQSAIGQEQPTLRVRLMQTWQHNLMMDAVWAAASLTLLFEALHRLPQFHDPEFFDKTQFDKLTDQEAGRFSLLAIPIAGSFDAVRILDDCELMVELIANTLDALARYCDDHSVKIVAETLRLQVCSDGPTHESGQTMRFVIMCMTTKEE